MISVNPIVLQILTNTSNHGEKKYFLIWCDFFYLTKPWNKNSIHPKPNMWNFEVIISYLVRVDRWYFDCKSRSILWGQCKRQYWGAARRGTDNVLVKLQSFLKKKTLRRIGCVAHMVHNTMKSAADSLLVDSEYIIVKIYSS